MRGMEMRWATLAAYILLVFLTILLGAGLNAHINPESGIVSVVLTAGPTVVGSIIFLQVVRIVRKKRHT